MIDSSVLDVLKKKKKGEGKADLMISLFTVHVLQGEQTYAFCPKSKTHLIESVDS